MFRVYVSILVLGYFVSPLIELATKTSALKRTNYKANWGYRESEATEIF
jgi:hypothetical protein